jgi:hypothetical protein
MSWCVLALAMACGDNVEAAPSPPPRLANQFRSDEVDRVLSGPDTIVATRGFSQDGTVFRGFLVDHGSLVDEAELAARRCYVVVAGATAGVGELHLHLYGSDGSEVAADRHVGRLAAIGYCPPHPGTYYLTARATEGAGLFAVRRYAGPAGLDVRVDDLFGPAAQSSDVAAP